MAHNTLVNGTSYGISKGRTLVGGTGYDITKGRTLVGGTGYDIKFGGYNDVFGANDWATIIRACENNEVPETWQVGDVKTQSITIDDVTGDCDFMIIGKNRDTYTDGGGTAPLTIHIRTILKTGNINGGLYNTVSFGDTRMYKTHLPNLMNALPVDISSGIKKVNKQCIYFDEEDVMYDENISSDLFLLSRYELTGSTASGVKREGTPYTYYAEHNSNEYRILNDLTGTASYWWLRTAQVTNYEYYWRVASTGSFSNGASNNSMGIAPAFCF